jgi:lipopolysaccharide exporter
MERDLSAVSSFHYWRARIRPALGDGSQVLIASHILQMALRVGSSLIVTRLLSPDAYGVVGILTSISYILTLVSDMGLRAYVVRHKDAGLEAIQTVWTVRLLRNSALFAIMFFGAPIFADAYNAPDITLAIRVCAVPFLIEAASSLSGNLMERNRGVIRLTVIEFARFLIVLVTTVVAAYFLRDYWAVVLSIYAGAIFGLIASYTLLKSPPIRFRLDKEHVRDLWKFWRIVAPASIITILMTQTNTVVMARYFPIAELGKFMIASSLASAVLTLTNEYVMRVFFPRFAHANRENEEEARAVYYDAKRNISLLLAFGMGGLIGGGELLVRILYNQEYLGAGFYLALLCLGPLGRLSAYPAEQALVAKGFIRATLNANIVRLIWMLAAGPVAYLVWGPIALVVAMCLAQAAALPYLWAHLKRFRLLKLKEEALVLLAAGGGFLIGFGFFAASEALIANGTLPNF